MAGSTISPSSVSISVTLGNASYRSPLTITPTGAIRPSPTDGAIGLVATISGGFVLNDGAIAGAAGTYSSTATVPERTSGSFSRAAG